MPRLYLSGVAAADELLSEDPLALVIGMVLDQQIPLEWAFEGPLNLTKRIGGALDARRIAEMSPDDLVAAFAERPALHRYPASMAARVQALCRHVVANYAGDAARIWTTAETGADLLRRVQALPGFGAQKAKIFVALLGKQLRSGPAGWVEASAPFGEAGSHLSVADIDSPDTLLLVREHKRAMKAAAKAAWPAAGASKATAKTKKSAGAGKATAKTKKSAGAGKATAKTKKSAGAAKRAAQAARDRRAAPANAPGARAGRAAPAASAASKKSAGPGKRTAPRKAPASR